MKQLLEISCNGSIWMIVSKMKWSGFDEASFEQHQVNLEVLEMFDLFLVLGVEFSVESCLSFEKKLKISLVRFWVLASLNLAAFIWTLAEQNCVVAAKRGGGRGGGAQRWAFFYLTDLLQGGDEVVIADKGQSAEHVEGLRGDKQRMSEVTHPAGVLQRRPAVCRSCRAALRRLKSLEYFAPVLHVTAANASAANPFPFSSRMRLLLWMIQQ